MLMLMRMMMGVLMSLIGCCMDGCSLQRLIYFSMSRYTWCWLTTRSSSLSFSSIATTTSPNGSRTLQSYWNWNSFKNKSLGCNPFLYFVVDIVFGGRCTCITFYKYFLYYRVLRFLKMKVFVSFMESLCICIFL